MRNVSWNNDDFVLGSKEELLGKDIDPWPEGLGPNPSREIMGAIIQAQAAAQKSFIEMAQTVPPYSGSTLAEEQAYDIMVKTRERERQVAYIEERKRVEALNKVYKEAQEKKMGSTPVADWIDRMPDHWISEGCAIGCLLFAWWAMS